MSKKLVKILSICAVIVLVPLIILGVALSVAGNKAVTLSIFDGGDSVVGGTESKVAIFVNNREQTSNSIRVKQGTEVTVTWEGRGFAFDGWFNGNESETQGTDAISTEKSYTFSLTKNTVLTALRHYVTYTVEVKYNALSSQTQTIAYNRQTDERDAGFAPYNVTRSGYTFKGLEYEGHIYEVSGNDYIYNGSSLSTALFASDTYSISATAVWESQYPVLNIKLFTDVDNSYSVYGVDGSSETELDNIEYTFEFVDNSENEYQADLSDDLYAELFGKYSSLYIKDSAESKVAIDFTNCEITINEEMLNIDLTGFSSLKDFMDIIKEARGNIALTENDVVEVTFKFTKVA